MRQLKEIASQIMKEKFSNDPAKMASELKCDLMYVRRAVGLAAQTGTSQQKTFEFTVKLLRICKELGIDPAQNLNVTAAEEEARRHVGKDADRQAGTTDSGGKRRRKKKAAGPFQASRIKGSGGL